MAKQFIRHLEYYGFPDQNAYSSDLGNVDLSDIIKKNKEQDEEIEDLEGEKADKADLDALSGTVDSLIAAQTEINQNVAESISGITADIEEQKALDDEFAAEINALTDSLDDTNEAISALGDVVDEVSEALSGVTEELNNFEASVEETYAKKEDTYTKEEIDEVIDQKVDDKLTEYATKEWVEEQGYLDQEEGDERYAKKETVDALSDRLNESVTDLSTKVFSLSGEVGSFEQVMGAKIGVLETNFVILSGSTERAVNSISGAVQQYDDRIRQNASDINDLRDELVRKASKAELESLETTVSNLASNVAGKVGQAEFEEYKGLVSNKFNNMDDKKADKTAITAINAELGNLDDKIDQEIANRTAADTNLQNQINDINEEIIELKELDVDYNDRIEALEDGLQNEITDRENADLAIIGTSADTKDDNTVLGAKAFASNAKRQAVDIAGAYTDMEISNLRNEFDNDFEEIERELTAKADVTYVDASRNELKTELLGEINSAIALEKGERISEETTLLTAVRENTRAISENSAEIAHNGNRISTITAWDGEDPAQYDDSGNGILDVLHREFHKFSTTVGAIKDVKIEDGNLIITYITTLGEETVSTPITDVFDANAYYDKTATDALLAEKADNTALAQAIEDLVDEAPSSYNTLGKISDYLTANTQTIGDINDTLAAHGSDIAQNASNIADNTAAISQNASDIAAHTTELTALGADVAENTSDIAQNTADIAENASAITAANDAIATANEAINDNATAIAEAQNAIAENASAIATANEAITENTNAITAAQEAIENLNSGTTEIEEELETKADKAEVEAELATKPSIQQMNTALATKADNKTLDNAFQTLDEEKADLDDMTAQLLQKVDKTTYNSEIASIWAEIERLRNLIGG